ncbi:cohesin domain-containing protein [Gemmatimonadota bacterium]
MVDHLRKRMVLLMLMVMVSATFIVTACDTLIAPVLDTELDNPIDPDSPETFVDPETSILSGPADGSTITTSSATFTYESNADLYQWSLLGTVWDGEWSEWTETASVTLEYLNEGEYLFQVRSAYDPGEGVPTEIDSSSASVTFIVDAVSGPSLVLSPLLIETTIGATFEIELVAEEVTDLMAVKAVIQYDPTKLTVEEVREGDFLSSTGGSLASFFDVDTVSGTIEINIGTAAGSPVGVSGTGTVVIIKLKGLVTSESHLTFDNGNVEMRDAANNPMAISMLINSAIHVQ